METGYCMKCKMKREMKAAKRVIKKGRHFMMGTCKKCGCKMSRTVAKK